MDLCRKFCKKYCETLQRQTKAMVKTFIQCWLKYPTLSETLRMYVNKNHFQNYGLIL